MPSTTGNGTNLILSICRIGVAVLASCGGIGAILGAIYTYAALCTDVDNIERRVSIQEAHSAEVDKTFTLMRQEQAEFREQYIRDATELKVNVRRLLKLAGQE